VIAAHLTRFAPAPTGWLHLGHVLNAVFVWGLAARSGAAVLLRVEDHDAQRARPEYEAALLDDLDWLGFAPDRYPTAAFRAGRCESRQSDRHAIYRDYARQLDDRDLLYGCSCTRQDAARAGAPAAGPSGCPGTCASRHIALDEGASWRVRMPSGIERFDDLLEGPVEQDPAAAGDIVIRDRLGNWTYQFAVAVDDFVQRVDLVVRGRDLLDSTGRQIALARLLGRPAPPRFAHHPLVMKTPTRKISKADGDTGIRVLRSRGWTPRRVIGAAAAAGGLVPPGRDIEAGAVGDLFKTL
jgi:glutamyl-tRNA synthetase/glutamyl-Q tRNA(Asp) synthetase